MSGSLYAVHPDGNVRWIFRAASRIVSSPVVVAIAAGQQPRFTLDPRVPIGGSNGLFDYFRIECRATPHIPDGQ